MTDTTTDPLAVAREHAEESWQMFTRAQGLTGVRLDWKKVRLPEGGVLLSGRIVGPRTVWALERFASDFHLTVPYPGDMRPQADLTQPERTVLVWRYGGVWVELWHPESAPEAPKPAPPSSIPADRRALLLLRPSGRLPFTRKQRTTDKENATS
jgi:hypothetical protein